MPVPKLSGGENCACGSSREAAGDGNDRQQPARLHCAELGDIFYSNCFQNGALPIRL
jgi:3-isopropylmalate/(R)-2-methylmalate dehydratase small subunit